MAHSRRSVLLALAGVLLYGGSGGGLASPALAAQGLGSAPGFRVQALVTSNLERAGVASARLEALLQGRAGVYMDLGWARYAVEVGDFLEETPALAYLAFIRESGFPDAKMVRTAIRPGEVPATIPPGAQPPSPDTPEFQVTRRRSIVGPVPRSVAVPARIRAPSLKARVISAAEAEPTENTVSVPGGSEQPRAGGADGSPPLEGFHGAATCGATHGWAWDPSRPDEPVDIEIYDGDRLLSTVRADQLRPHLVEAGKGNGRHAFVYRFEATDDEGPSWIYARFAETGKDLPNTPRPNPCRVTEGTEPPGNPTSQDASTVPTTPPASREVAGLPLTGNAPAGAEASGIDAVEDPVESARKSTRAQLARKGSVSVDGRLDEDVWASATYIADFVQKGWDRTFERPHSTEVAFIYDDDALYVGARMESEAPEDLDRRVVRRDDAGNVERLLVSLDTYLDRRTSYTFGVTVGGVRLDQYHAEDVENRFDRSFDPVWEARTRVDSTGWTAEMRIPFSQLRFNEVDPQVWGVNVRRWNPETFLNLYWVATPSSEPGWASRFGDLEGIRVERSAGGMDVTPYVVAGVVLPRGAATTGTESAGNDAMSRVGGELQVDMGGDLTVDATINPDFGQVEADPSEVNLTAFETAFRERRPFFVEGNQLLSSEGPRYFYSRRIGALPAGMSEDNPNVVDLPTSVRVLGAVRVTGRRDSGLSVGALTALTSNGSAQLASDGMDRSGTTEVAPRTLFSVGRVVQELGTSGSSVGLTLTAVGRDLAHGSEAARILARSAVAGGGDWNALLRSGEYRVSGHVSFSHVAGDPSAITRIQRSAAHYFQRPDQEHVTESPESTGLSGYAAGIGVSKVSGKYWTWDAGASVESPGFEIRDAGIMRSADDIDLYGTLRFRQVRPARWFQNYRLALVGNASWNYGGVRQFLSPALHLNVTLMNFWRGFASLAYEAPVLSDELTRGGPLMKTAATWDLQAGLSSAFASRNQWSLGGGYRWDGFGGWSTSLDGGFSLRLTERFGLSVYSGYSRGVDPRQFYGQWEEGPTETFGSRYVFSFLERSELYTQLRLDLAATPDVTLELYAEPFTSSGAFRDYGLLTEAGASEVLRYGDGGTTISDGEDGVLVATDQTGSFEIWPGDFNVRSFRSSAVLRWEWRPGSTMFLIWQQNRWRDEPRGEVVEPGALLTSLSDPGEDVFTAKLTYHLGLR